MADILGSFEQAVLLAVVRLSDEAYGRAILKDVQKRLDRDVAAGAVHSTLERLEQKGMLTSGLAAGNEVRAGRPRRYYKLEPAGRRALNESRAAAMRLWNGFKWPLRGST